MAQVYRRSQALGARRDCESRIPHVYSCTIDTSAPTRLVVKITSDPCARGGAVAPSTYESLPSGLELLPRLAIVSHEEGLPVHMLRDWWDEKLWPRLVTIKEYCREKLLPIGSSLLLIGGAASGAHTPGPHQPFYQKPSFVFAINNLAALVNEKLSTHIPQMPLPPPGVSSVTINTVRDLDKARSGYERKIFGRWTHERRRGSVRPPKRRLTKPELEALLRRVRGKSKLPPGDSASLSSTD